MPADLIHNRAVDCVFQHCVRLAIGAADQTHLFQIVLGLEQVTLFSMPHAVIRPSHSVIGIGGEWAFVPDLGVVVAPELAARITDQVRHGVKSAFKPQRRRTKDF